MQELKIWFDADNGPHALIMRPLAERFAATGHEVVFTARDRTNTPQLLDLYGFSYRLIGGEYAPGTLGKVAGTIDRAWRLAAAMRKDKADVAFGHGSRALPIAARLLGVPNVTMYDYEWVNARLFNWGCRNILLPDAITGERCREAGIAETKVCSYPGYKEELYLGGRPFDSSVARDLGLRTDSVHVLLRPPATTAHYHNPQAEAILEAVLARLADTGNVQLVYLPRTPDQRDLPRRAGVAETIIPDRVYDGPSLVAAMDLVISGGGTMVREAAILGVGAYSFFRGRSGMVDESLEADGRLTLLPDPDSVATLLDVAGRPGPVAAPAPDRLVEFVTSTILAAARR